MLLGGEWNPPGPASIEGVAVPREGGVNTFPIPLVRAVLPALTVTVKIPYRACDTHGVRMQVLVIAVTA